MSDQRGSVLRREKKRRVLENKWKQSDEGRRSDSKIIVMLNNS